MLRKVSLKKTASFLLAVCPEAELKTLTNTAASQLLLRKIRSPGFWFVRRATRPFESFLIVLFNCTVISPL